ncbi:MAG: PaREP1 family protein [Aigarchaeota archaeon]|nr:PaREP1 family protein [Candidatus Wolframiiraptor gerlachensis]
MTGSDLGPGALPEDDVALATAEEILGYAEEEFRKAVKTGDILLYRSAVEKAFLAMVLAVNSYIKMKLNIIAKSHAERRSLLRRIGREDLRAMYSDIMRTLHDEAFYEGVYNPGEAEYAITLIRRMINEFKKS